MHSISRHMLFYFEDITTMAGASDDVSWYDKDLDDFDITVDRVVTEDENDEDESGMLFP